MQSQNKDMRRIFYILYLFVAALMTGCTGTGEDADTGDSPSKGRSAFRNGEDTIYTLDAAMNIYGYQPTRALQILDSAVIVGNISKFQADISRARIYSSSLMNDQLDSLLGGPKNIRLDSARIVGERMLRHDSVKSSLERRKDVLEILTYTARMRGDTLGWMQRALELVDVCHQQGAGAETDALRTEAEIGASLCFMGQREKGMAKLDSVINCLTPGPYPHAEEPGVRQFRFNELDALIIALKRKIAILSSFNQYAETLPLSRRIIEQLEDYEANPDAYHDSTKREPADKAQREDYIRFYRNQAQNFLTAAYSSLIEHSDMLETFEQIETSVHDATAREHIARYDALQKQMEAERQHATIIKANLTITAIAILALLILAFALVVIYKNRTISRKNRILAKQIAETVNSKNMYWEEKLTQAPPTASDPNTLSDEQLFKYLHEVIVREKLFLSPSFGRQSVMERFNLSKERVGAVFSKGGKYANMSNYIQHIRLEYAAKLLVEQPDTSIVQIAADSGFSSCAYFSDRFRQHFGISPSGFRQSAPSTSSAVS